MYCAYLYSYMYRRVNNIKYMYMMIKNMLCTIGINVLFFE